MTRGSARIRNIALLALWAGVAALGLVNWRVMDFEPLPPSAANSARADTPASPVSGTRPVDFRPLSDFEEVVRRPLFTANRTPFVATGSTSTAAGPTSLPP